MAGADLSRSSDLLLPPEGAGVAFIRKELGENVSAPRVPPKIFRVKKSSVTSRVQSLLPLLAKADHELQQRMTSGSPDSMNVENVTEDEPHVAMDLAVIPISSQPDVVTSDSGSSSESEGESEGGMEEGEEEGNRRGVEGGEGEDVMKFPLKLPKGMRHKKRTVNIHELPCR